LVLNYVAFGNGLLFWKRNSFISRFCWESLLHDENRETKDKIRKNKAANFIILTTLIFDIKNVQALSCTIDIILMDPNLVLNVQSLTFIHV